MKLEDLLEKLNGIYVEVRKDNELVDKGMNMEIKNCLDNEIVNIIPTGTYKLLVIVK